jgi:tetratricopeptide (TPR) repeat protein
LDSSKASNIAQKNANKGGLTTAYPVMSKERLEQALFEKEKGNAYFAKGNYKRALSCYTKSLSLDEGTGIVYGNRAMAWIKLEWCVLCSFIS